MVHFIKCSIEKVKYCRSKIFNNPVNLNLCQSISKSRLKYYPDNTGVPSIRFKGCDTEWVYDSAKERDIEFDRISSIKL